MKELSILKENFKAIHTHIENVCIDGEETLRVLKADKIMQFDENTYAKVNDLCFHNGIIEVDMKANLLPDAPDFARGFIGIIFRANDNDSKFECFYVRPTNGKSCNDPIRRSHGCQYFSYPGYTFAYFREFGIEGYEAEVSDIDLNEWIHLKAEIEGECAKFYINDDEQPRLVVENMIHGDSQGSIGFFSEIGTDAYFKNLKVELK